MSKLLLSYLFKTNLATFRSAIIDDNTDKICRILDIERDYLHKEVDSEGNTALILAIKYASPLTVRLLLEQGALSDQPNGITGKTPLTVLASKVYEDYHSSKAQKSLEMVKILLDHGAFIDKPSLRVYKDENDKEYSDKETPLMTAVRKRNLPLAKLLIEKQANVNYIGRQSQVRAIHFAVSNGDEAMYDLLENAGALICAIVTGGDHTLLHWFCTKKGNDRNSSLLNKLLDKGCDVNAGNWEQRTPLMMAAKNNMIETCRILLKNKADLDKQDSHGNQAIDLTVPGSECSQLLLQQGHIRSSSITPSDKIIWRKRIDSSRRTSTKSIDSNQDGTDNHPISTKWFDSEEEGEQSDVSPHPYVRPTKHRHSAEFDKKCGHIWGKLHHTTPKRPVSNNFYKPRSHSADAYGKAAT